MIGYQKQQGCTGVLVTQGILLAEVLVKQRSWLLSNTTCLLTTKHRKIFTSKASKSTTEFNSRGKGWGSFQCEKLFDLQLWDLGDLRPHGPAYQAPPLLFTKYFTTQCHCLVTALASWSCSLKMQDTMLSACSSDQPAGENHWTRMFKWKVCILAEEQHTCCTGAFSCLERITGASLLHLKEKVKSQKLHNPEINSPRVPANSPSW